MTNPLFDGEGFEFEHLLGIAAIGQREQQRRELAKLNNSQSSSGKSSKEPSTQDVAVDGELDDSFFNLQSTEIEYLGSRFRFHYTIKIKKAGKYRIVAGQLINRKHVSGFSGSRIISGDPGDVFSGGIDTPSFSEGLWAFAIHKA